MKQAKFLLIFLLSMLALSAFAEDVAPVVEGGGILASILPFLPAAVVATIETVLGWVTAIVTAATAIVVLTPTPKDDSALAFIRNVLSVLSGNVGNNK